MANTATNFQFDLVSPDALIASEEVSMVVIPGDAGDFGVLADHAPLLSSIRPGVVTVTSENGDTRKIFVSGGFADVSDNLCTVLAQDATDVAELDADALTQKIADLKEDLDRVQDDAIQSKKITNEITVTEAALAACAA